MIALITGASSGVGKEIALLLDKKGISTILCGTSALRLQEVGSACKNCKKTIQADLAKEEERKKIIETIWQETPDIIINNAGFAVYGNAFEGSLEEQIRIFEVNAKAPLKITLEGAKALLAKNKKGVILNVSSVAGEIPSPLFSVYGASKAFLTSFSISLDAEVKDKGISILVALPGMIRTPFAEKAAGKKVFVPKYQTISPLKVAKKIVSQIERKKGFLVIDWRYKISLFFATYAISRSFLKKLIMKRLKSRL